MGGSVVAATERFGDPLARRVRATTRALVALALLAATPLAIARSARAQDDAVSEAVQAEVTPTEAGDPAPIAPPTLPSEPFSSEPRFFLRGGYQWIFGASTVLRFDSTLAGIGTAVDFSKTLGGERTDGGGRLEAVFRITPHHSVAFAWFRVDRSGTSTLDRDFQIGDRIFKVGSFVSSELDISLYRFLYNWSFYRSEKVELALSPGLYVSDIRTGLSGSITTEVGGDPSSSATGAESRNVTLPLPSLGLIMRYEITKRLSMRLRADWFYLRVSNIEGSLAEFTFGPEYLVTRNFGLGVAYDRFFVSMENDAERGYRIDNSWNTAYLYGIVRF